MVARRIVDLAQTSHCCTRRIRLWLGVLFVVLAATVPLLAQNFRNSGSVDNTGTFRVQGEALGLPPAIDGIFEYFGANQNVPAVTYRNLVLSGSGTKTTIGGNFTVQETISIAPPVTLKVPSPDTITLLGTLVENGYLEGSISKSVALSGATTSSSFGDIGATIVWTGIAPGQTTVTRTSGVAQTGAGNQSIRRTYRIEPAVNSGLQATLLFRYSDNELNGQDENTLELWRSVDDGLTWRRQGGIVNTLLNTITKTDIPAFSLWTASDAAHPLGPADYEWVARNLLMVQGDGAVAPIRTSVPPLVAKVTDAYGNPIAGRTVAFQFVGFPTGALGFALSENSVVTDLNGFASTILTLGDKVGSYVVSATADGLVGSPLTFMATATSGNAASIVMTSGNGQSAQINSPLPQPLTVTVRDAGGNPTPGISVTWSIQNVPPGASGQRFASLTSVTNAQGQSSASFVLGDKVGLYSVTAVTAGAVGSPVTFTATATHGPAAAMVLVSGNEQVGTVSSTLLEPLRVILRDAGGNPVPNETIVWVFTEVPEGASGQELSPATSVTNADGFASTEVTLGTVVGTYRISATAQQFPIAPVVFTATAVAAPVGAPAALVLTSGDNQSAPINSTLPLPMTVTVVDVSGRPVPGVIVSFAFDQSIVPAGAVGHQLSVATATTDTGGRAATVVTLGNKVGRYDVLASSPGLSNSPLRLTATATHGSAFAMRRERGDEQAGPILTQLPEPLTVTVVDEGGNAVPGTEVTFVLERVPAGAEGHALSASSVLTDHAGRASVTLTLGNRVGEHVVRASSGSLAGSPLFFRAMAVAGAPAVMVQVSGNDQQGEPGQVLPLPLVVRVLDRGANAVPGTRVTFAVTSVPSGAQGQQLSTTTAVTNAQGEAATSLTLGNVPGAYVVTANAGSDISAAFIARATILVGDANRDGEVNIADLTSVIDHILQRITLTGADSAKADVNADGAIDVLDVIMMQRYLLAEISTFQQAAGGTGASPVSVHLRSSQQQTASGIQGALEATDFGIRFHLKNDVPVKGLQLILRFRGFAPLASDSIETVFARARMMYIPVRASQQEVRLVAYNLGNDPIEAGEGSIFRFPPWLRSVSDLEGVELIVSTGVGQNIALRGGVSVMEKPITPRSFVLEQNYPNPFNPATTIEFEVPDTERGSVFLALEVYNQLGERIVTLTERDYEAGRYRVVWQGTDERGVRVASGVYFYRLVSKNYQSSKKMILVK